MKKSYNVQMNLSPRRDKECNSHWVNESIKMTEELLRSWGFLYKEEAALESYQTPLDQLFRKLKHFTTELFMTNSLEDMASY